MAFGFPPSYSSTVELAGSRQNARSALRGVLELLGWPYSEPHSDLFVARVPMSWSSWGEVVTISFEPPGIAHVESRSRPAGIFDWGKNRKNVENLVGHFAIRELRYAKGPAAAEQFHPSGKTPLERALDDDAGPHHDSCGL